jgi:hypothetical protein
VAVSAIAAPAFAETTEPSTSQTRQWSTAMQALFACRDGGMVAAMGARFEMWDAPNPWGNRQPKFERLERDGEDSYFVVYRLASGEETRVRLGPTPRPEQES